MSKTTKLGVPGPDLDDETLDKELRNLYRTREETFFNGSASALRAHTDRMLELEHEYARRFPERIEPDPERTRRGKQDEN